MRRIGAALIVRGIRFSPTLVQQFLNDGEPRAAKLRLLNFLSLFRDLQKPTRFSGGGSGRIFP